MTSLPRRLAAVGVVLLSLVMVAFLALRSLGVPLGLGPLASATPEATTTPSQVASPSGSADPLEVFAEIEAQVQDLRDLPAADIGPPDVITRDQLADELEAILAETWTPEELASDNLTLRAMGLLEDGQDIRELTQQLYVGQVLGFYDFKEKRMVVVSDAGLTPEARITYAHEYTHALQDAAFDTGAAREAQVGDDDAALARIALEEGDATWSMFQWALAGNLSEAEMLGIAATPLPDMSGIPEWMVAQLTFPYEAGLTFVSQLIMAGGWSAVDAAYRDPPASTEQVLHADKYLDGEDPVQVDGTDLVELMAEGWVEVEATTVGEATLGIWLTHMGVDRDAAARAAAGWGGDRLTVAQGPDDAWTLAWSISWDSASQANEFEEVYGEITAEPGFATAFERISSTETRVVHASADELLALVLG